MKYISLFSGIEAASVAWAPLGWTPVAFSEVDRFCCDLLKMRFPDVRNLGDIKEIEWGPYRESVDIVVGGSPCQAFSTAGNRRGLDDERSALMLEYIRAIHDIRPRWLLWENVPGVLSQSRGDAFETLLDELEQCGYSLAWRILDAQFFGVAQRRRRVFVVGHARAECAAAVLFELDGMRWDFATAREKRAALTGDSCSGAAVAFSQNSRNELRLIGGDGSIAGSLCAEARGKQQTFVAFQYGVASERNLSVGDTSPTIKTDKPPAICMVNTQENAPIDFDMCGTLTASIYKEPPFVCLGGDHYNAAIESDMAPCMTAHDSKGGLILITDAIVRRLTPVECERLQGFPDGWTDIYPNRKKGTPDGLRYKALGNSMAVPIIEWIGRRIEAVDRIVKEESRAV